MFILYCEHLGNTSQLKVFSTFQEAMEYRDKMSYLFGFTWKFWVEELVKAKVH